MVTHAVSYSWGLNILVTGVTGTRCEGRLSNSSYQEPYNIYAEESVPKGSQVTLDQAFWNLKMRRVLFKG